MFSVARRGISGGRDFLIAFTFLLSCKDPSGAIPPRAQRLGPLNAALVVPRRSMGQVTIGQEESSLSATKNDNGRVEIPPGISALIEDGKVVGFP